MMNGSDTLSILRPAEIKVYEEMLALLSVNRVVQIQEARELVERAAFEVFDDRLKVRLETQKLGRRHELGGGVLRVSCAALNLAAGDCRRTAAAPAEAHSP